jgi:MFS family permease
MAATVGDFLGPAHAAAAFGTVTLIFGLGQLSGPTVGGMVAEATGSFAVSFALAAVLAGLALILSLRLKSGPALHAASVPPERG